MDSWFLGNMEELLFNEKFHDVVFTFPNGEKIFAHAVILSFSSEVFSAQLNGSLRELNINIMDADAETFRVFLRCLYTGQLRITFENMFDLAHLAQKYMIPDITKKFTAFFEELLKAEESNFCKLFCMDKLELLEDSTSDTLLNILLNRAAKFLTSPEFLNLSEEQVGRLVRCEQLAVHEFHLYKAVVRWAQNKCLQERVEESTVNMRKHVRSFIHQLRMTTLRSTHMLMAEGICKNNLLCQTEKQALLFYCAGETSTFVPFELKPRRASLDVLVASAKIAERTSICISHSTFFMPKCNMRLVAVNLVIERSIRDHSKTVPITLDFELKPVSPDRNGPKEICEFSWMGSITPEKKETLANCSVGVPFPLYAGQNYVLIARCEPLGVFMHGFKGNYERDADKVLPLGVSRCLIETKRGSVHAIKAFKLLLS